VLLRVIVLNATFNNISVISWQSVLLVEETGENHRPVAYHCHWQTLSPGGNHRPVACHCHWQTLSPGGNHRPVACHCHWQTLSHSVVSSTRHERVMIMMFNATFNNISVISWRSVLLVGETRVPGENHWSVARHPYQFHHIMLYRVHLAMSGMVLLIY
jgi:hypothetical protein